MKSAYDGFKDMVRNRQDFCMNWVNYQATRVKRNPKEINELRAFAYANGFVRDDSMISPEYRADFHSGRIGLPQERFIYVGKK